MELGPDLSSPLTPGSPAEPDTQPRAAAAAVQMPALAGGTAAHAHTVDSALVTLRALGIGEHRIRLYRSGRNAREAGTIVRQSPPAGTPLSFSQLIELEIAGLGFTQALPVGMWDSGGEAAAGTLEILQPLDDPLEKLKHWFHEGAPLFRLGPDDLYACERWLALFGIVADDWPTSLWYRLAALVANIPQLACSEDGCAFLLGVLLNLPVQGFQYRPVLAPVPEVALSRLTSQASRLGVDLLLGDRSEDLAMTVVEIGPVTLDTFERFNETDEGAALLERVLGLIMPLSSQHEVRWLVQDAARPPQLGVPARNSRLGINTHMGTALPVSPEAVLAQGPAPLDRVSGALRRWGKDA